MIDGSDYVSFIDYSLPCYTMNNEEIIDSSPFLGKISLSEFEEFLRGNYVVSFKDYVNVCNGTEILKKPTGSSRNYVLCDKKILAGSSKELS